MDESNMVAGAVVCYVSAASQHSCAARLLHVCKDPCRNPD
jgi:hypothetical protein